MNRAEKRRQKRLAKEAKTQRSGSPSTAQHQTLSIQQGIDLAIKHHNAGDLPTAENICLQILQSEPNQPVALHLLGVIAHQVGKNETAVELMEKALAVRPDYPEAHYEIGNVFKDMEKLDEAIASYRAAIAIAPGFVEAHNNLGNALEDQGNLDEALVSYRKTLALKPDLIDAHFNIGIVLKKQGKLDEAIASYREVLAITPDDYETHNNIGNVFKDQGNLDEAVASFRKALALRPGLVEAHSNLGITLNMCGQREEALEHFDAGLTTKRVNTAGTVPERHLRATTKSKLTHDIEQFEYLASLGEQTKKFQSFAKIYREVLSDIQWPRETDTQVLLSDDHLQRLENSYNHLIHRTEAPELPGSTLSGDLDVEQITADYFSHEFGMAFFDGLLSSEALASLRRYLLESTIWFNCEHKGGYLGAMLDDGLACPLLLQIADDLRRTFPDIFKHHKLQQLWAYKYDSQLRGIKTHADFAAVNVNFWITPDDANLDPDSGGLVVHNAEAPIEWDFKSYNADENRINEHIAKYSTGKVVVPHRQNRILLFNSNLFHGTDTINFKTGYENRRINITMLFGDRTD